MHAATAKIVRASSNTLRLPSSSTLPTLPLSLSLSLSLPTQTQLPVARCFHFLARLQAKRPSPLVNAQHATPRLKSLFPNTIVHRIINAWPSKRSGTARFVLLPADTLAPSLGKHHPAVTRLPPPTGMLCYVQIVSTPTADTPGGCVMLHFDNRRYLFGRMAEGTQRNMVQRKISLAKIHDIFLTGRIDWDTTGGLLGMILTLADLKAASSADVEQVNKQRRNDGKKEAKAVLSHLNIHGGKNLVHLLASARRFILRKAMPVEPREVRHDPRRDAGKDGEADYEDENIKVWSIPLSTEEPRAHTPGHQSPKKRKLSPSSSSEAGSEEDAATEEASQNIRQAVVRDMFNSKWNLDTLREMRLAEVRLPAKIFIRNDQGHIQPYSGPPASQSPDTKVLVRLPWPASQIEQLPRTQPSKQSMCYIVKGHSRRGKFDIEAANRLGVAKMDFRKLTAGESVLAKDGSIVTPDMVLGATIKGHGFAVVDIPSADLIDHLIQRPEFSSPEVMEGIDVMYWILSDGISLDSPGVRPFVEAHSSVKHIVLGSAVCPNVPALESPMSQLIKMNRIDRERFPLPIFDTNPTSSVGSELEAVTEVGRAGLQYQLAPKQMFLADTAVPVMDTREPIVELTNSAPQVLGLASAAYKSISNPSFLAEAAEAQRDLPCPEAEIVPLGTGSAMPSKYRNVSATLIRVPGWGNYLFDCGENTLGQLRRAFGYKGADDILKDLRAIYISHAHADHHLGTINIIAHWRQLTSDSKLAIIATPKYQDFVREFHQVQDLAPDRLVPVALKSIGGRPQPGGIGRPHFPAGYDAEATPLPTIEACFVDHCYEATALVLTFPDTGLKLAYSGDCRPSRPFAELGKGAHLLIHECTFDDDLGGDALAKKHSTMSEALGVGRDMEARRILLTHFSQRYPKLPVVNEAALKTDGKRDVEVLFAFDLMRVKLGEFKQAKAFLPALRELLREGEREEEG